MIQVKLKIEEFFDGRLFVDTEPDYGSWLPAETFDLLFDVLTVIASKCSPSRRIDHLKWLNPKNTRETIIQALEKLQLDYIDDYNSRCEEELFCFKDNKIITHNGYIDFYAPSTRIITITKFNKEEKERTE